MAGDDQGLDQLHVVYTKSDHTLRSSLEVAFVLVKTDKLLRKICKA